MSRLTTFDVFDTLITRRVAPPDAVFLLLGRRLHAAGLIRSSPEAFVRLRMTAERHAVSHAAGGQPTLADIYRQVAFVMGLSAAAAEQIANEEISLERALCVPTPQARTLVVEARRHGPVAFVSDTYFSRALLIEFLQRAGVYEEGDHVLASCEEGAGKYDGSLFRELLRREGSGRHIVHRGNHEQSDVAAPRGCGIRVDPVTAANTNRYERAMEQERFATDGATAVFAGASRLARMRPAALAAGQAPLRVVAAGVAAPVLSAFVTWVLTRAHDRGLRRLYFVSRDGQVLLRVARHLLPALGYPIELRYLYGSRQAWRLPAVLPAQPSLDWALDPSSFLSIRSACFRVGLEPDQVTEAIGRAGFGSGSYDAALDAGDSDALRRLFADGVFVERVVAAAGTARATTIPYLRQEHLLDDDRWGLVDVGWRGSLFACLDRLLATVGAQSGHAFYFGLMDRGDTALEDRKEAYFFDRARGRGNVAVGVRTTALLETFCAGDHGLVAGYDRCGDSFVPRLLAPVDEAMVRFGIREVHETVSAFAGVLAELPPAAWAPPDVDLRGVCGALLDMFWSDPQPDEALTWGTFPYVDDQAGRGARRLGEPYRATQAIQRLLRGYPCPPHSHSWPAAARLNMSAPASGALRLAGMIRSGLGGLRRWWRS